MKARSTKYKGIQMRSRLEAGYAELLDTSTPKIAWTYEAGCFASDEGQYLPDFRLGGDPVPSLYIEVKPSIADEFEALKVMHIIRESEPAALLAVWKHDNSWPITMDVFEFATACTPEAPCSHCDIPITEEQIIHPTVEVAGGYLEISCAKCGNGLDQGGKGSGMSVAIGANPEGIYHDATMHYFCGYCHYLVDLVWKPGCSMVFEIPRAKK